MVNPYFYYQDIYLATLTNNEMFSCAYDFKANEFLNMMLNGIHLASDSVLKWLGVH